MLINNLENVMFNLQRPVVGDKVHTMNIVKDKVDIIDQAFSSFGVQSFADLGAVRVKEGAYTFHALDKYPESTLYWSIRT